jgi:hypothetical protein
VNAGGVLLALIGIWLLAQILRGALLQRLGIIGG